MNMVLDEKTTAHVLQARERILARESRHAHENVLLAARATSDAKKIIAMIIACYRPLRIYQWGSLLRPGGFKSYSDIDVAVEGICDAERFFALLGQAQEMTEFPVDIVQMEKIAPEYAEDIRMQGKLVYERT